jgi:hypothetical protein
MLDSPDLSRAQGRRLRLRHVAHIGDSEPCGLWLCRCGRR